MLSKEELLQLVKQNIHKISISEFVAQGGYPVFSDLDILVFSQKENNGITEILLDILYDLEFAGCCFIPGRNEKFTLSKTLVINNNEITFKN